MAWLDDCWAAELFTGSPHRAAGATSFHEADWLDVWLDVSHADGPKASGAAADAAGDPLGEAPGAEAGPDVHAARTTTEKVITAARRPRSFTG
jgi:hypothetical protein